MPTIKGFQWDAGKNALNFKKHGIDFDEAVEVFYQPHCILRSDRNTEERWIAVGETDNRLITVVFTWRDDEVRIISARRARKNEERAYYKEALGRTSEGQD
jgi:uncharacterized DUF497 family protein